MAEFKFREKQLQELKIIAQMPIDLVDKTLLFFKNFEPMISLDRTREALSSAIEDYEVASAVVNWGMYLRYNAENADGDDALQNFGAFLKRKLSDAEIDHNNFDAILELANSDAFLALSKSQMLSREVDLLAQDFHFVVDERTVFNAEGNKIFGKILMPMFKVTYSDGDRVIARSFACDKADLFKLQEQVTRCIEKIDFLNSKCIENGVDCATADEL